MISKTEEMQTLFNRLSNDNKNIMFLIANGIRLALETSKRGEKMKKE